VGQLPISAAANGTVTITVTNTGPANAVLLGIFLGYVQIREPLFSAFR
jgi:hypothetical protein